MKFLVIPKNWKGNLDRTDKWTDSVRLWIYANLGAWGTRVQGIPSRDTLRTEIVYGLSWIVHWLMRNGCENLLMLKWPIYQ